MRQRVMVDSQNRRARTDWCAIRAEAVSAVDHEQSSWESKSRAMTSVGRIPIVGRKSPSRSSIPDTNRHSFPISRENHGARDLDTGVCSMMPADVTSHLKQPPIRRPMGSRGASLILNETRRCQSQTATKPEGR